MMHEAQMHPANCVVRLSYDAEHLPKNGSLAKTDYQAFIKRLRKRVHPQTVRYFHCGEYGENHKRPHYHAVLFGIDFAGDRYPWVTSPSGFPLYRSPLLESLWPLGHSTISEMSFEAAQYVAKYVVKNINLSKSSSAAARQAWEERYERICPETGEVVQVEPEYATMSRRPGIGASWFDRFASDVFPSDFLIVDGRKVPVPRYYDQLLEKEDASQLASVKKDRKRSRNRNDDTPQRLLDLETCTLARQRMHKERRD